MLKILAGLVIAAMDLAVAAYQKKHGKSGKNEIHALRQQLEEAVKRQAASTAAVEKLEKAVESLRRSLDKRDLPENPYEEVPK